MLKLLVILFVIKLYARIIISFLYFTKIKPLKSYEKCYFIFGNIVKVVPGIFRDFVQKQNTVSEDFWSSSCKISLSSKGFLEGIDYISSYLPKSD